MKYDEVIRLAREAGLYHFYDSEGHCDGITDARLITEDKERDDARLVEMLAPFAALVAEAERECCARLCEDNSPKQSLYLDSHRISAAVHADIAHAIRSRGNT